MRLIALLVALLPVFLAAVAPTVAPAAIGAEITLQLNWKPEPQFGGFYAADAEGSYKKNGLDVKVEPGGAGTPTVQMVAAGRVPYGIVSADELIIARAKGIDVVALFAVYQTNPQGIMTRASRGFTEIGQIFKQPGILAMQKGLPYALYLEKKYGFAGLQIMPSPFGDLTAYRTRENYAMQCFVTSEPLAATRIGIEPKTFLIADSGYNPYTTVLVTRGDYLKANEAEAKSVVAAVAEGWRKYVDDPAKTNERMMKLNPAMDAETFKASAEAQKPLIETDETRKSGLGSMTKARWETLIGQLKDLNVIKDAPTPESCYRDLLPR